MRDRKSYFREQEVKEEYFWPSFTDMMAMIVLVIMFIAVIAFVQSIYEAYGEAQVREELAHATNIKDHISDIIRKQLEEDLGKDKVIKGPNDTISIQADVLFDSASTEIKPGGKKVLNSVADAIVQIINNDKLSRYMNTILIEGHTDSVPYDNWTLSTDRAVAVVKYMLKANPKLAQKPYAKYLAATGYSKYRPIAKGNNPQARKQNRRISFQIILDDSTWTQRIKELVAK
ncbi:MAG TPA: OmpA family protein [Bacillales bacterium]|nr:OmpA family protein [Bacillales bacterium]